MSSPFAAAAQAAFPEEGWGVRWNEQKKRWEARAAPNVAAAAEAAHELEPRHQSAAELLERVGSDDGAGSTSTLPSSDLAERRPAKRRAVPSRRYSPSAAQQLQVDHSHPSIGHCVKVLEHA